VNQILNTSITILLWKHIYKRYSFTAQRVSYIYHNSLTHGLINRIWEKIKICFRYSFLGRITETEQITSGILDGSRMAQYLVSFCKRWMNKITQALNASSTIDLAKDTKKDLYFSPVRVTSIIVVIAITTNVFMSIILQKQIGLWGWLMRGLFYWIAVSGLFCKADWPTVKRNSVFLRKIRID